jgi:3',5'-cyclic AMP phosphodiesterase CpdA
MPRALPALLVALIASHARAGDGGVPGPGVRILKGPYLQWPATDGITIRWETDRPAAGEVTVERAGAPGAPIVAGAGVATRQVVRVEGLAPSTLYRYRVRAGETRADEATFTTAARADEPFRFIVFGDNRDGHGEHEAVVGRLLDEGGDFLLSTGDLVAMGSDTALWQTFFDIEGRLLSETALWPALGNHELYGAGGFEAYRALFSFSEDVPDPGRYYAFTYGNARFFVLDSNDPLLAVSRQTAWLEDALAAAAADPDIRHLFVVLHHGPYSTGPHGGHVAAREVWAPLFSRYGVDVVFSGHDHTYARLEADGVRYVISGGGGAPLYPEDPIPAIEDKTALVYYESSYHYVRVQVTGDVVELVPTRVDGSVIESVLIRPPDREVRLTGRPTETPAPVPQPVGGCGVAPGAAAAAAALAVAAAMALAARRRRGR